MTSERPPEEDRHDDASRVGAVERSGLIAFGDEIAFPPPGATQFTADVDLRPATPIFVRVTAGLDTNTGVVTWQFTSLDPVTGLPPDDPLVGFLPPNVNSPEGQRSVLFSVKPKTNLASGLQRAARCAF